MDEYLVRKRFVILLGEDDDSKVVEGTRSFATYSGPQLFEDYVVPS